MALQHLAAVSALPNACLGGFGATMGTELNTLLLLETSHLLLGDLCRYSPARFQSLLLLQVYLYCIPIRRTKNQTKTNPTNFAVSFTNTGALEMSIGAINPLCTQCLAAHTGHTARGAGGPSSRGAFQ